jgi:uncharacterized RDD family membrane protein YckC
MANFQPLPSFPGEPMSPVQPDVGAYASWGRRAGAYLVDALLGVVAATLICSATGHHDPFNVVQYHVVNGTRRLQPIGSKLVFFYLVMGGIEVLYTLGCFAARRQATLGMRWAGIAVARESDLGRVPLLGVAARTGLYPGVSSVFQAVLPIAGLLVLVDLLWPLWDDRNQTLHDKVAKTVVLRPLTGP